MTDKSKRTTVHLGSNIVADIDELNVLTIRIGLTQTIGASKSGKSQLIASTNGNQRLPDGSVIGLNVYRAK